MLKKFLIAVFFVSCSFNKPSEKGVISEFGRLSQEEKRHALVFMIDSLEHEMFGVYVTKNKTELIKYGGLPGYFINHYPTYTSGGLLFPVMRVYNHRGRLVDSLVGAGLAKNGSLVNIGGFSKPFDFAKVRIEGGRVDKIEESVRRDIMNAKNTQAMTRNMQYYSPEFMSKIPESAFIDVQKTQNIATGTGYDTSCLDTVLRETFEETGMKIDPKYLILIDIHGSAILQKTSENYDINSVSNGVCSFMIEMGDVYLDKNGEISQIKINEKAIKNSQEIAKNFDKKNMIMKGGDDLENGLLFAKIDSLKLVKSGEKEMYKIKDISGNERNYAFIIGGATSQIPKTKKYKTCKTFTMRAFAKYNSEIKLVKNEKISVICE